MKNTRALLSMKNIRALLRWVAAPVLLLVLLSALPAFARDVSLSWTHSTTPNVTNYKIYRGTTSGGPYSLIATVGYVTTYTDTHVPPGTYYYVVTSVDSSGNESVYSNEAVAVVTSKCDLNNNGPVNVSDVQILVNVVSGITTCPTTNCDLNDDIVINVLDIQTLVNVVLGRTSCPY